MSTKISTQPHGDVSGNLEDSFLALLKNINPYIDDILTKPAFHHFLDLPLELRCKVYDQYFLDNIDSMACKTWPTLLMDEFSFMPQQGRKIRRAFLPKLCLVNKALQKEQLDCLVGPMHLDCDSVFYLAVGHRLLQESLESHCLLGYVHNINVRTTNDLHERVIDDGFWSDEESEPEFSERFEPPTYYLSLLLPEFPRIRQLSFAVHAPLRHMGYVSNASNLECVRALPIDSYIEGLDVPALLGMKELTKLTIIWSAGSDNCSDEYLVPELTVIEEDGKIENLQGVKDLAREIKDGFKKQGQDVAVEVRLKYGGDKEEEIVME